MNIFVLDTDPHKAAIHQLDKHIVKMPLETAQMLCSALVRHGCEDTPYKAAYRKHPCTIWAGDSRNNFNWLIEHGLSLCKEYTARYGREHKSQAVIEWCATQAHKIPQGQLTEFAQAMPDHYKDSCPVVAYRSYYLADKARIATWKRNQPGWWN